MPGRQLVGQSLGWAVPVLGTWPWSVPCTVEASGPASLDGLYEQGASSLLPAWNLMFVTGREMSAGPAPVNTMDAETLNHSISHHGGKDGCVNKRSWDKGGASWQMIKSGPDTIHQKENASRKRKEMRENKQA